MTLSSALKSLFTICVFTAFAFSSVESYQCAKCFQSECASADTCETSEACFSYKQQFNSSGHVLNVVEEKGCSSSGCSQLMFSATLGEDRTFGSDYRCCKTEQCNKGDVYLPQKSSSPNGIECPACYNEKDKSCNPVPLKCTGEETKCIEVTGTELHNGVSTFVMFGKGCATKDACDLQGMEVLNRVILNTRCLEPTSGSSALMSVIPPVLTSLFLLKVLL